MCIQAARVVVTFYLRLRNEFKPYPTKNQASDWLTQLAVRPIRGLLFGGICLEFIYLYQIKGDYNFRVWCEKSCLYLPLFCETLFPIKLIGRSCFL